VKPDTQQTGGMIMKGKLKLNGTRKWDTVAYTALYPAGNTTFDHGFSGITISADGKQLYINSGSRTDHGEEQNNGGLYPGAREVPLTSAVFKIAANKKKLYLPDDSALLAPYLFADGVRNTFDLAFSPDGFLFGCDNAGERDDPEELNWLRKGKHYGFPWIIGGDYNPQQFPGYDPDADVMLSKDRFGYKQGFFHDDPSFPPYPSGLVVMKAVQNLGPDCDFFRDSVSALVKDASVTGHNLKSLTPHRAPLGLVFDYENALAAPYKGDGFMMGYQQQGDSSGRTDDNKNGTLLDPSQDVVHVKLTKSGSKFTMHCTRIVGGFYRPVDAFLQGNIMYVIENTVNGPANIWKITLPASGSPQKIEAGDDLFASVSPNPVDQNFTLNFRLHLSTQVTVRVFDLLGKPVTTLGSYEVEKGMNKLSLSLPSIAKGYYVLRVEGEKESVATGIMVE